MNSFLRRILLLSVLAFVSFSAVAEPRNIEDIVNPEYYGKLVKNGFVRIIHEPDDDEYVLMPETEYKNAAEARRVVKKSNYYPFITESLYILDKKNILDKSGSSKTDITVDDVSVVFRAVSKMEGMKYYSLNKKKEEILYKSAYTIDNPDDRKKIPDRTDGNADGMEIYCFQHDQSFGKCVYRLEYYQNSDVLYATFNNVDSMGMGIIRAVSPGDMRINAVSVDCGDKILFYLGTDTDCVKFPGIRNTLINSLTARMDALYKWFVRQF